MAGSILFITVVGNVLPINWYFRRHVGLDVRWFWVRLARLLPSMLVPAIVAVLIAVLAPVSGYLDILIWGCVFVAVYVASLWPVWHEPLRAGHRHRSAGQIPPQAPQKGIISFKQPKGLAVCKVQAAGPFDIPAADGLPGRAGETVCATAPS